jgi:hypothetical protein
MSNIYLVLSASKLMQVMDKNLEGLQKNTNFWRPQPLDTTVMFKPEICIGRVKKRTRQ